MRRPASAMIREVLRPVYTSPATRRSEGRGAPGAYIVYTLYTVNRFWLSHWVDRNQRKPDEDDMKINRASILPLVIVVACNGNAAPKDTNEPRSTGGASSGGAAGANTTAGAPSAAGSSA